MTKKVENKFEPDYVSPPGETLLELLEEHDMTQAELCRRIGRPRRTINEIIKGKVAITPETSLQLEMIFGQPTASYWLNLEYAYREALARIEQEDKLQEWIPWLEQIPLNELVSRNWVKLEATQRQQVQAALKFFGVASPERWRQYWDEQLGVSFRMTKAFPSERGHLAAWLRAGELIAKDINCAPYDAKDFRQTLYEIRNLTTTDPDFYQEELGRLCAKTGVAVVFLQEFSKARVHGATRWLTPEKPLIQLSLRQSYDDQLWFSFFHEAGHVLLHSKKETYIEEIGTQSPEEDEANRFAENILIPEKKLEGFVNRLPRTKKGDLFYDRSEIIRFAQKLEIAPSIVVGRLMNTYKMPPQFNHNLRTRLEWETEKKMKIKVAADYSL